MKSFGAFAVLALYVAASSVSAGNLADTVSSCGEGIPMPTEIYVDGCYENPCDVRNGDVVTFELVFTPPRDSPTLSAGVRLLLGRLEIPFTLSEDDANGCNGLVGGSSCPISAGVPVRYRLGMLVDAFVTGVTVDIRFHLEDASGQMAVCYEYSQTVVA